MKRKVLWILSVLLVFVLTFGLVGTAFAKSLYLVTHHQRQFQAWNINAPGGTINHQANYSITYAAAPAGVAIHEPSGTLFISSESQDLEMVDKDLNPVGVSHDSQFAGLAVDDRNDILYAMQRSNRVLWVYQFTPPSTLALQSKKTLSALYPNSGMGIALDELQDPPILWVADGGNMMIRAYNTSTWTEDPSLSFSTSSTNRGAVGMGMDRRRGIIYWGSMTSGAYTPPNSGSSYLYKFDLNTRTLSSQDVGVEVVDVSVDEDTGLVYITERRATSAWDTATSPWTRLDYHTLGDYAAGICVTNVSYMPDLAIEKVDDVADSDCVVVKDNIQYTISYENTGETDLTGVTIVDTLPSEVDYVSSSSGGIYTAGPPETVTWNIGNLAVGASGSVTLDVQVNATAAPGSTIINYATIDSNETNPTTVQENTDVCTVVYADGAVVSMDVVDPPAEIPVSDEIEITVREVVHNFGPFGPADFDVTFNAAAPDGCEIVGDGQKVVRVTLPVSVDTTVDATFTLHCSEPSFHRFTFENEITPVDPIVIDTNPDNNTGATSLTVAAIAQADLAIQSWDFDLGPDPAPLGLADLELDVSDPFWFPTRKVVHNFGDTVNTPPQYAQPVDADVFKLMDIPAGMEGSVHISAEEAPATIVIDRPDGTSEVLSDQPASTVVKAAGPAKLSVYFKVPALEVSVDRTISEDFDLHCLKPGYHTVGFGNKIKAVDQHIEDPNLESNEVERSLTVLCLNHYLGYDIKHLEPQFEKREVILTDQFVSGPFRIEKANRLYTPADKEILPELADPAQMEGVASHLMRYKVKTVNDGPKKVKVKNIVLANQFGEFAVEAHGPYYLLAPTAKAHAPDVPEPGAPAELVDHFLCYKIKKTKITEEVSVADQFGLFEFEVKDGKWLCNPVEKVDEAGVVTPIVNPGLHLMLFDVKHGQKVDVAVNTDNQFGPQQFVVYKQKELCVPTTKTLSTLPEPIGKCKGIAMIELAYGGTETVDVEIKEFGTFTVSTGDTILLEAAEGKKLPKDIKLKIDSEEVAKFHTSCSKPIEIGDVSGDFEIMDLDELY